MFALEVLSMKRRLIPAFAAIVLMLAASLAASAQVTGGAVNGAVSDAAGAAVPSATVTLTSKTTGQALNTQTTDSGVYNFPNVAVGEYTIKFENTGFAPVSQEIRVLLNQTATVNATLQAGQVTEQVTVTAASEALVQTDQSQLTRGFETRQVQDLPIFGNQNQLAVLSPNVVERSAGVTGSGGSVGGTRPRGNSFVVDGVDNNDASITGPVVDVIQDSVAEFSLITNNWSAEFGDVAGGLFNTVTKSGSNEFHGSGFLYQQSERFNAASTAQKALLQSGDLDEKPRFRDQRAGFTVGGPVYLPTFGANGSQYVSGKNRLFFFFAFERRRQDSAGTIGTYFAPTSAGLDQIAALPGASPFVVNFLRKNLTLAPSSTFGFDVLGTPIPFGEVNVLAPQGFTNKNYQINIDHTPNSRDQFHYRLNLQRATAEQQGGEFGTADPRFNNLLSFSGNLFSANWVRSFGSSVVNDLRLAFRRHIQAYPLKNPEFNDFPNIVELNTAIDIGPGGSLPQGTPVDNNYQLFDTVNYTRGSHTFKFGGEYRNLIFTSAFLPRARGDYLYASFDTLIQDQPADFSNLRGVGSQFFAGNQQSFYVFAQDDWRLRPNLTLNMGLRYEFVTIPRDARLQGLNAVSSVPGVIDFHTPRSDKNNFGPRVGFAYSPSGGGSIGRFLFGSQQGESSIRANFAVGYYANFQNLPLLALPPQVQTELNLGSAAAAFGFDPNRPFLENGGLPGVLPTITTAAQARQITQARIPDQINPYSLSWTLSYQRQLTPTTAVEFRYLATRGRHLPIQVRLNNGIVPANLGLPTFLSQPTAAELSGLTKTLGDINAQRQLSLAPYGFLGSVTEHSPSGNSQYDSGSVSLTRRFSRGLALTAAYTWSKTIDDSTNELNTSAVNARRPQDIFDLRNERGLSALDIPHRFVLSYNYEAPTPFSDNRVSRFLLGGFQFAGIFQAESGQPITPISGVDSNRNGDAAGDRTIVNPNGLVGTGSSVTAINAAGQPVASGSASTVAYVANNPNAQYIQAGLGAIANAGRNTLRTPGFNRTDMTILKNFRFGERYNLQVGAEVFDLFNQKPVSIFTDVSGLVTSTSFATAGNAKFNDYSTGEFPGRTIQLRAKFIF
jgi:Carboxypeptidase regulatory-like domain/TonB dependent receptor